MAATYSVCQLRTTHRVCANSLGSCIAECLGEGLRLDFMVLFFAGRADLGQLRGSFWRYAMAPARHGGTELVGRGCIGGRELG